MAIRSKMFKQECDHFEECFRKYPDSMQWYRDPTGIMPAGREDAALGQMIDLVRCIAHRISAADQPGGTKSRRKKSHKPVDQSQITACSYPVDPVDPDFALDMSKAEVMQLTKEDIAQIRRVLALKWPEHAALIADKEVIDRWSLLAKACEKDLTDQLPPSWSFAKTWATKVERLFRAGTGLSYSGYLKLRTQTEAGARIAKLISDAPNN